MTLRISTKKIKSLANLDGVRRLRASQKAVMVGVMMAAACGSASAQSTGGLSGLCALASWLKTIAGAVAIIAVLVLVINSFFGKSDVIGEIITKVLVGCAIIGGASALISSAGLTPCSI